MATVLKRERSLRRNQLIFFDRGTTDSLGYFQYYHLNTNKIVHACQHLQYKKIFYCHKLPIVYDAVRVEDNLSAQQIGEHIYEAYVSLGYQMVELPAIPVEQRIKMIIMPIQSIKIKHLLEW